MNKKIILLCGVMVFSFASFGQKAKVREANREMDKFSEAKMVNKVGDQTEALTKAKAAIDLAVQDPSTSEDPKTWLIKANVYLNMQEVESLASSESLHEGVAALKKALELNPKLENNEEAIKLSYYASFYSFNKGLNEYNQSQFEASFKSLATSLEFLGQEKNKKFAAYNVDTLRSQAKMLQAFDLYYMDKRPEAIKMLKSVSQDPFIANQSGIYLLLAQAYEKEKNTKDQIAIIEEGLKKYPDDQNLKNAKFNSILATGNYKELEEAVANEPTNMELAFNLGIIYQGLGMAKDGVKPADAQTYLDKAEAIYKKVLASNSNNGVFNYQLGAFYFNQAAELTTEMNRLPISEKQKYENLKQQRDDFFQKALPLLEKSKSIFAASNDLSPEEKSFQTQSFQALINIYTNQDELDKADALTKELQALSK